jgi:hypothetical protein
MSCDNVLKSKCDEGEKTGDESAKCHYDLLRSLEPYKN